MGIHIWLTMAIDHYLHVVDWILHIFEHASDLWMRGLVIPHSQSINSSLPLYPPSRNAPPIERIARLHGHIFSNHGQSMECTLPQRTDILHVDGY